MKLEDIRQVTVVGAGAMGSQIALLLSQVGGYPVNIVDVKDEAVNNGIQFIKDTLKRHFVDKDKMTEADMNKISGRIKGTTSLAEAVKSTDYVIEAAFESMEVKKSIFKQVDQSAPAHTVITSNTSFLNITEMAKTTQRPDRVAGMHFFNPVAVMKLVEVVKTPLTSAETLCVLVDMAKKLGKEPIVCKDFSFGFLANRAYTPMALEAIQMVWERVASPEDIDRSLKLGYNLPMGPLELMDYAGAWALWVTVEEDKMREFGPEAGHLHPLIRMMVRAGYTGGRGKKGVYDFYKEVLSKE